MDEPNPAGMQPEEDFASIWAREGVSGKYSAPTRGDIRQGVIVSARPDAIVIDIGAKQDALVAPRELQQMRPEALQALRVGDKINVYILRVDDREDHLLVSLNLAREYSDWEEAQKLLDSGEIISTQVVGYNKGGLLCTFKSLQGFVPASHIAGHEQPAGDSGQAETPASQPVPQAEMSEGERQMARLVGRELHVKVIEVNRRRRRLVFSERAAQREWRIQQRERLLAEIAEGEVREGMVSSLRDFGAFVDLGGVDGLVHLSELSWSRIRHPSQVLKVGQTIQVMVLRVDREQQRISLSLKRTQPDPWVQVAAKYKPGMLVTGVVTHLANFGAFVEIEPGVEGLIHLSELAEGDFGDPANIVTEGEELQLLVLGVDSSRQRIALSLRQVVSPPESEGAASS